MKRLVSYAAAVALAAAILAPAQAATHRVGTAGALRVAMMPRPGSPGAPIVPPALTLPLAVNRPFLPIGNTAWPGNMPYYGGRVVVRPRVYVVFWGWRTRTSAYASTLLSFLRGVGGSPWLGVTTQYYETEPDGTQTNITNPTGQLAGSWYDAASPPANHYAETLIAGEAVRAAKHFHVVGDRNAVVLVASPAGRNPAGFVDGGYCGWHSWTSGIAYINLPYLLDTSGGCGSYYVNNDARGLYDGVSMVAAHEYAEAITDPGVGYEEPGAGWHDLDWQENGDKCEWVPAGRPGGAIDITLRTGRFAVPLTWSNAALQGVGDCAAS